MPVGPKKKYREIKPPTVKKNPEKRSRLRKKLVPVPHRVSTPNFSSYLDLEYDVRDTWASIANDPPTLNESVIQKGDTFFAFFDVDDLISSTGREMFKRKPTWKTRGIRNPLQVEDNPRTTISFVRDMQELCTRGTNIGVPGDYLRDAILYSPVEGEMLKIVLVYEKEKLIGFLLSAEFLNARNEKTIEIKAVCKGRGVDKTKPIFPAMLGIVSKYAEENNYANLQLYASTRDSAYIYTKYNFRLTNMVDPDAEATEDNAYHPKNGYFMTGRIDAVHDEVVTKLTVQDARDTEKIEKEIKKIMDQVLNLQDKMRRRNPR